MPPPGTKANGRERQRDTKKTDDDDHNHAKESESDKGFPITVTCLFARVVSFFDCVAPHGLPAPFLLLAFRALESMHQQATNPAARSRQA